MATHAGTDAIAVGAVANAEDHLDSSIDMQRRIGNHTRTVDHTGVTAMTLDSQVTNVFVVGTAQVTRAVSVVVTGTALPTPIRGPHRTIGGIPAGEIPMTIDIRAFTGRSIPVAKAAGQGSPADLGDGIGTKMIRRQSLGWNYVALGTSKAIGQATAFKVNRVGANRERRGRALAAKSPGWRTAAIVSSAMTGSTTSGSTAVATLTESGVTDGLVDIAVHVK